MLVRFLIIKKFAQFDYNALCEDENSCMTYIMHYSTYSLNYLPVKPTEVHYDKGDCIIDTVKLYRFREI